MAAELLSARIVKEFPGRKPGFFNKFYSPLEALAAGRLGGLRWVNPGFPFGFWERGSQGFRDCLHSVIGYSGETN